jgi:putative oxidoreductase
MKVLESASRIALGWVFVHAGSDVLRNPEPPAKKAEPVLRAIRSAAPVDLPDDQLLVRINAGTQVVAGAALAAGLAPRVAALALIGSIVPTTAGGHRFWEFEAAERTNQRNHFLKNLSILGGLLHVVITPRNHGREANDES